MALQSIHQAFSEFFGRTADASAAIAAAGTIQGEQAGKPGGHVFLVDMEVSSEPDLRRIGSELPAALQAGNALVPGPQAAAALGIRTPDGLRIFLYQTGMDPTGDHPQHDFTVVGGGRAQVVRLGSVLTRVSEIGPDGSLVHVETVTDGEPPGDYPEIPAPKGIDLDDAARMAVRNLGGPLLLDMPDEATALDWTTRTYGAIVLTGEEAPPRLPKPASAAKPKKAKPRIDLSKLIDRLKGSVRPAYLPELRPAQGDEPACGGSKAFIPEGTSWPTHQGEPMAPVLQIDVGSMPEPARSFLGGEGLFQLFCPVMFQAPQVPAVMRVVPRDADGTWHETPPGALPEEARPQVVAGWRETWETPTFNDLYEGPSSIVGRRLSESQGEVVDLVGRGGGHARMPAEEVARIAEREGYDPLLLEQVAGLLTHHEADKVLGWPTWLQAPEWPTSRNEKGMVPLIQFVIGDGTGVGSYIGDRPGVVQVFVTTTGMRKFRLTWA